jgi:hypothetical protein
MAEEVGSPEILAELRLQTDRTTHLSIVVPVGMEVPARLRSHVEGGDGSRTDSEAGTILRWSDLDVPRALELLTQGQRDATVPLNVRIVMAPGAAFEDLWDVQYALAQGGIRRVRFVSGEP